jgi:demethylmenaquinone methyltransferase/2-methoxy-6-polyprenyl-1,4-benzoquinol methylase
MSTTGRRAASQQFLDDLYGRLARRYDLVNAVQSAGLVGFARRAAARRLGSGLVLDVGAGSGDLAAACLAAGADRVVALDRSGPMLAVAREKLAAEERAGRVVFMRGDVFRLPFDDETFDHAGSGFVFRNLPAGGEALAELYRVLKPGGNFASVDVLAPPPGLFGAAYRIYLNTLVPVWGRLFAGDRRAYKYLAASIQRCFTGEEFALRLEAAGFEAARAQPWFGGICYVVSGRKP